jgi:hypothetical protein
MLGSNVLFVLELLELSCGIPVRGHGPTTPVNDGPNKMELAGR